MRFSLRRRLSDAVHAYRYGLAERRTLALEKGLMADYRPNFSMLPKDADHLERADWRAFAASEPPLRAPLPPRMIAALSRPDGRVEG